ncbi:undecaprenyldiphospho-muramoylpentapeptide beta-N-acetylglucosaminyltransferase [Alphaproteobacteria bacterium]|nr:undecaprenyldiphospho-muramoylpentapeptide beta-N-acetylglucosaminyltransferase [Alphaproteobacteria bacterium]
MNKANIFLATGGTGGHIYPAEALARELLDRGYKPILITDKRGSLFHCRDKFIKNYIIMAGNFSNKSFLRKLIEGFKIIFGILEARKLIKQFEPRLIIGFGGYSSLPTMIAGSRSGIITIIHEQNAVLGKVNKFLSSYVDWIALSFMQTKKIPKKLNKKCFMAGNPIRLSVLKNRKSYTVPKGSEKIKLLIIGGSQGANILSEIIPKAILNLPSLLRQKIEVTQQCRKEDLASVSDLYKNTEVDNKTFTFIDNIGEVLSHSHLVISRSGASSIFEIASLGIPSILIPYKLSKDNHQFYNAKFLEDFGAAWIIDEDNFTVNFLKDQLNILFSNFELLSNAASAASKIQISNATKELANNIERIISKKHYKEI